MVYDRVAKKCIGRTMLFCVVLRRQSMLRAEEEERKLSRAFEIVSGCLRGDVSLELPRRKRSELADGNRDR